MVKMGNVWDRTSEVLSGRAGMLAGIAVPTLLVPTIVRDAYVAYATPGTVSFALVGGLLSIVVLVVMLWGELAIIAAASHPTTGRTEAQALASKRLLPLIGVSLVLGLIITLLFVPALVALGASGMDWRAMAAGAMPAAARPGALAFAGLYSFVAGIIAFFVFARLAVLNAVVLHEQRGLGALRRSWQLTRGHTWRIVGVLILFSIVFGIAVMAASSVSGLIFRLILGSDATATVTFLAGVVGSIVSTIFTTIALAFVAQLYVAFVARQPLPA
ncbi:MULTISPECIES: glycerophosphoryl diester phosphodiesterase membrane domain-containing protein [unclassified Sphingomonas]|uniref:glycerophosphoryl diester phosphodiesterase membrane domain-containing protein n=2 Tax=Sphingomonas TaxID=13687 RepID=UPI00226AF345|nr:MULTISPECIES: glycerophosphoryl diester phosphodiesterase membrane domain-containing protein [unclassified Sphingomonas]